MPFVTINKKIITDENQQFIKVPCPITYVITVSNNKNSTVNFVNPVVLDILPTGVTYDPDYDPVVSTGTSGEDINMASITPIRGEMVQKVKMPDGVTYDFADPETAVVFRISGSLQPGSSFTITFKAKASASATLYEVPGEQTKIQNDVYLSSSVHSYYTEGNINGYSFAVSKGTDGYNFGQSLENSASGNGVSAIHESGVHGDLTDPENSDTNYTGTEYSWIHGNVDIGVIGADRLTLSKAVYGDRDEGFHSSGLGVATRTNSTPGKVSNGWVKWRLEVYNGDDEVAEKLVMGDVIPKVGDDPNERHSRWDVIFDQIETVKVNGTALTPDSNKAVNVTVPTKVSDLTDDAISGNYLPLAGGNMNSDALIRLRNSNFSMVLQPFGLVKESNEQSHVLYLPDATGTIALTSQIPDISGKQDTITDLATIRNGAALGATALQSYTETDPTVPA